MAKRYFQRYILALDPFSPTNPIYNFIYAVTRLKSLGPNARGNVYPCEWERLHIVRRPNSKFFSKCKNYPQLKFKAKYNHLRLYLYDFYK